MFSLKNPLRFLLRRVWQNGIKAHTSHLQPGVRLRVPDCGFESRVQGGNCSFGTVGKTLQTVAFKFVIPKTPLASLRLFPKQPCVKNLALPAQQASLCFILLKPPAFKVTSLAEPFSVRVSQIPQTGKTAFSLHTHAHLLGGPTHPKQLCPTIRSRLPRFTPPETQVKTMRLLSRAQQAKPELFQLPMALRPTRITDLTPAESAYYLKLLGEQAGCPSGRLVLRRVYRSVPVSLFQEFGMHPHSVGKSSLETLLKTKDWLWATPKPDSVLGRRYDNKGRQSQSLSSTSSLLMDLVFGMRLDTRETIRAVIPVFSC